MYMYVLAADDWIVRRRAGDYRRWMLSYRLRYSLLVWHAGWHAGWLAGQLGLMPG
jgi:hypothetical protein